MNAAKVVKKSDTLRISQSIPISRQWRVIQKKKRKRFTYYLFPDRLGCKLRETERNLGMDAIECVRVCV